MQLCGDANLRRPSDASDWRDVAGGARVHLLRKRASDFGRRVFEAAAPEHLANERDMLAGLTAPQQRRLADLLRPLLHSLEAADA